MGKAAYWKHHKSTIQLLDRSRGLAESVGVHEIPGENRIQGKFIAQAACPSPATEDTHIKYTSVFFPQASPHLDQLENRIKQQVPIVFMRVCLH